MSTHCGLHNGYLRYHLAIEAPRATPPTLRVKDHHYTRQEGESVLFDDTWSHEIKNECSETRVVLIVDILRPMRGMAGLVNWAMFLVGRFTYAFIVSRKAHSFSRVIRARQ